MIGTTCRLRMFATALAVVATTFAPAGEITRDQRIEWWREARFGMFIHWGLYAIPGGTWKDTVPSPEFILPAAACHILGHPDFIADLATIIWIDLKEPKQRRVAIVFGKHLLVSKPLVGSYPNYQQVIPAHAKEIAVIPHDRKPGLIAWLRAWGKDQASVRLDWHKRGQLTLTHRDANGHSATLQVPVEIHGSPPVIEFNAAYLARALEIGSTLCLSDELSPGICRHPTGRFCVIMPMLVTIPAASDTRKIQSTADAA